MSVRLEGIVPAPIAERDLSASQIWNQSLRLNSGRIYHVQAPSGMGKSTFIHILYGTRRDFQGQLFWYDLAMQGRPTSAWASIRRKQISIVFQDLRLFPELTARDNLMVKFHLGSDLTVKHIEEMAEFLGVSSLMNRKAGTLSFGERQRFAILRALIQPFDFLLMDEPFSHLDLQNREKAAQLIQDRVKLRKASLVVAGLDEDQLFNYDEVIRL